MDSAKRKYYREYKKAQRERAVAKGLCYTCTIREPDPGFKICNSCRESSKRRLTPGRRREYRDKYQKEGLCRVCARPLFGDNHLTCMICRQSKTERGADLWK